MNAAGWFIAQAALAVAAVLVAPGIARQRKAIRVAVCGAAFGGMLLWPLMRVFPVQVIDLLGAPMVACTELTGLAVPATLFFGVATRHLPRASDRRAVWVLLAICGVYFVRAGWWMVSPGVKDLGATRMQDGVCLQSTVYTCVPASMVTLLRELGCEATETEMAQLAGVEVGGGATDSRAVWALQRKLRGTGLSPRYVALDREGLIAADKPCLVQLRWGFFTSHMVPVLAADGDGVTIGDPANGRRTVPWEIFLREWKGQAIVVERAG